MKLLYDFHFQLHLIDLGKLFILLVFGLFIWFAWKAWKEEKGWKRLTLSLALSAVFLTALYSMLIVPLRSYSWAKKQMETGQYGTIEGQVRDYQASPSKAIWGHSSDSFFVGDVEFVFCGDENYGYCVFQCDGGSIHEGQNLRIKYLEDPFYGERRICEIEEME